MIAYMTANDVARETGWAMHGWGHGDRTTNDAFAPLETFSERFDALLERVRALGFDTVDLWGAHLGAEWATVEHVAAAVQSLDRHGLRVATYATWLGPQNVDAACRIARALGTDLIGAGFDGEAGELAPTLRRHGVRLAHENHPERTPQEALDRIAAGGDAFGFTIDTGWWATQGYDAVRAIEELGGRILHVHLKDVRHEGEPHETCRWGEGIVPIEDCVRTLRRLGYAGALSIEHEPETEDPSDDCRAMLGELREWLR